jgi:hypothetical protein
MPQGRLQSSSFFKEAVHDQRTSLVKEIVAQENAKLDARTASLRALRLAKEAAEIPQKKSAR